MAKIELVKIFPNPEQPREDFDPIELEALAESIRQHGVINPISVEGPLDGGVYILIDGERRWRASAMAGLTEIEASVRPSMNGNGPRERLTLALVANLQRQDMNWIEEGKGFRAMLDLGYSVAEIAEMVGMHASNIYTRLNMLDLPEEVQRLFATKKLPLHGQVVTGLRGLPEEQMVRTATSLAIRNATISTIISITKRLKNAGERGGDRKIEKGKNPMRAMAEKYAGQHWNMVLQAKTIQLDAKVARAAEETCKDCALYDEASERVCRDCPAVSLLRKLSVSTGVG